ncbi:hypothetical protein CK203_020305 [Vitis vinifera]|uniref:Amidase n=1 Tax=Vitis vinifera TaxID=29760 RepID=A0A438IIM8_VITVI|nr:hypothetical protein CK203_020305 [Vitis vinifera]
MRKFRIGLVKKIKIYVSSLTMAMAMALRMQSLFMLCGFFFANSFVIQEATIKDIQHAFSQNQLTSRQLVDFYLHQIQALNPKLHGVIEVNPDAGDEA